VDERRGDERVTEPLAAKVMVREPAKFLINKLNYLLVAFALGLEELVQEDGYVAVHCHPRKGEFYHSPHVGTMLFRYARVASGVTGHRHFDELQ
jgi:hypothetical protein